MSAAPSRSARHRPGRSEPDTGCVMAVQACCNGPLVTRVQGVTATGTASGRGHIALQYGRILVYLEDQEALKALTRAVQCANDMAEEVFGPESDSFVAAERAENKHYERLYRQAAGMAAAAQKRP